MNDARLQFSAGCVFARCIPLSADHRWGNPRMSAPADSILFEGSGAPENVRTLLAAKCDDCHFESAH